MIATSLPLSKIIDTDQGAKEHYHVPKYQREYAWGKKNWEQLLLDIDENDVGYFMGSIICVKDSDPHPHGAELIYDVVDGQQRLSTLSLLMMAIYKRLQELREDLEFDDDEDRQDFENSLSSLRNKLVKKRKFEDGMNTGGGFKEQTKVCYLRVQPSTQNSNLDDYLYILGEIGILKERDKPWYLGVRSVYKAFRYFQEQLPKDLDALHALVAKINQLVFVHIIVGSQSDAFTLFETLNNRGVALSAIDIIKNKVLAEMEKQAGVDIDESYERWQGIIEEIPEATDQERFLRHYYNAFRWDPAVKIDGIPRAIKSKLIAIYEKLIRTDANLLFESICEKAETYGSLLYPEHYDWEAEGLGLQLRDVGLINASPAYMLLLYLFSLEDHDCERDDFILDAIDLIQRFYVRRNVTDFPGTRDLDQGHIEVVEACQKRIDGGDKLNIEFFRQQMLVPGKYASLQKFEEVLRGPMYSTNFIMTRYLLVKLDQTQHTREYNPDLWARNEKDKYVWTVEHVLPQTENLPQDWVDMVGNSDKQQAAAVQEANLHRLGNLTLSGYNSKLSTASLSRKQTLQKDKNVLGHKINIGFKNGLSLNNLNFTVDGTETTLADSPTWTADTIEARTTEMVNTLLSLYKFDGVE